jgi:hypothetical protein
MLGVTIAAEKQQAIMNQFGNLLLHNRYNFDLAISPSQNYYVKRLCKETC